MENPILVVENFNFKSEDIKLQQIKTLVNRFQFVDNYTFAHSVRVMQYATGFANYMNYSKEDIKILKYGSILHDIGKIVVPKKILNKKGKLDKQEYEIIKKHPYIGYEIVNKIKSLGGDEKDIILHHHERIDGKGYPDGLNGTQLSRFCKIVSIADAYDAMISQRPYRSGFSNEKVISKLWTNSGTQFDIDMVKKFINYIQ